MKINEKIRIFHLFIFSLFSLFLFFQTYENLLFGLFLCFRSCLDVVLRCSEQYDGTSGHCNPLGASSDHTIWVPKKNLPTKRLQGLRRHQNVRQPNHSSSVLYTGTIQVAVLQKSQPASLGF